MRMQSEFTLVTFGKGKRNKQTLYANGIQV
jgi:hypothetical protein